MNASKLLALALVVANVGCATTKTEKIIRDMAIAGAVGILIAQQKHENRMAYSAMYGGLGAAGAGVAGLYIHDPEGNSKRLERENAEMRARIDRELGPRLEIMSPGTMGGKIPDKYSRLVNPGQWRIYATDQWIEDGENRMVHQDKIMELIPPSLLPGRGVLSKGNQ